MALALGGRMGPHILLRLQEKAVQTPRLLQLAALLLAAQSGKSVGRGTRGQL